MLSRSGFKKENDLKKNADPLRLVSNTFKRFIAEFIQCLLFALKEEILLWSLEKTSCLEWKEMNESSSIGDFQRVHFLYHYLLYLSIKRVNCLP